MLNWEPSGQESAVTVLAVIPDENDQNALRGIFRRSNWALALTGSIAETMRYLERSPQPVVLFARDLPDGRWEDLLAATQRLSHPPRLVITSRFADEHLWAEALNLGCHDVLAQPFLAGEVFRVLNFAWRSWHGGGKGFAKPATLSAGAAT
jgi:DNA-binding NtrC family response regulator